MTLDRSIHPDHSNRRAVTLLAPILAAVFAVATLALMVPHALADDTDTQSESSIDIEKAMSKAREHIANGKLKKATKQLNKVVKQDKSNADAWNLLGYSWRKLDKNKKSAKAYSRALKLDPDHKGALEYQGELFIKLDKIDSARENLARLEILCPNGCEQLDNLKQALAGKSTY